HRRYTDVAVAGDPLALLVGDVSSGQQAPPQRERLGLLADPGCAHRLLVGNAPGVNVWTGKQYVQVMFRKRDFGGELGELVAELVALLDAVLTGDGPQRLGAVWPELPGL